MYVSPLQFEFMIKMHSFSRLGLIFLFLGSCVLSSAQTKRWEHNVYLGIGRVNNFDYADNQTTAFHAGYGLNYYLTPNWSIMPGIGIRAKIFGGDSGNTGNCEAIYLNIPVAAQYHFSGDKRNGLVAECGVVLSFLPSSPKYMGHEWFPTHPFRGAKLYKSCDFGIQPGVYYETQNWRFGVQSYIGLTDIKRKYPIYAGSDNLNDPYHFFDVVATVCYHW